MSDEEFKFDDLTSNADDKAMESDPILGKHLDIAIEAQDGKVQKPEIEGGDKGEENSPEGEKKSDPKDSKGGTDDNAAQSDANKEGKQDKGNTAGPKDLTLADGTIVKGGKERRFYEQAQTAKQEANHWKENAATRDRELTATRQELASIKETVALTSGLPPAQLNTAVRMYGDLQRDPVGTVKKLLAEAVSLGHSIEGIGAGVDAMAIQAAIERAGVGQRQDDPVQTEQRIAQETEREVTNFYSKFPDARTHDALFAKVLQDNPTLTLEDAYFQVKSAFSERGYDWSRPLEDNVREQQGAQQEPQPNQQKPMPNGRDVHPGEKKAVTVAHENTDMGDIIRDAMRESGLKV